MLHSGWCCCRHAAARRGAATGAPPAQLQQRHRRCPVRASCPTAPVAYAGIFRIQKSAEPFFSTSNTARGETLRKFLKTFSPKMDLLICNEVLYKDHHEDDLGLGGLRSLPGKPLILTFHLSLNLAFIWSLIWPLILWNTFANQYQNS